MALRFVVATALIGVGLWRLDHRRLPSTPLRNAWIAFVVVTTASAALAFDVPQAFFGDPVRMMGVIGWLTIAGAWMVGTHGDRPPEHYARWLVGAATIAAAYAVGQWLTGTSRPGGPMGNPILLGGLICLALPVALERAWSLRGRRQVALVAITTLLAAAALVASARGGMVGIVVGAAIVLISRGQRRWTAPLVVVAIVFAVAAPVGRTTAEGRFDTWRETADVIAERPVLGWGPEGFRVGFAKHVSDDWVRKYTLDQIPDRAHNALLDVTVASGVLGVAAYLGVLGLAGIAIVRRARTPIETAMAAGLAAYVAQAQFSFDTFDLAVVAALLVGVLTRTGVGTEPTKRQPTRAGVRVAATALAVVACFGFVSDRLIKLASGRESATAFDRLNVAATLWPHSFDAGSLAATVATANDALTARAVTRFGTWPDPYVRLRVAAAELDVEKLLALRAELPTNPELFTALAAALFHDGDDLAACEALDRALDLTPGERARLTRERAAACG